MWKYIAKALGSKAYDDNQRADKVALIRFSILFFECLVGVFIILNAIANHGWGLIGM